MKRVVAMAAHTRDVRVLLNGNRHSCEACLLPDRAAGIRDLFWIPGRASLARDDNLFQHPFPELPNFGSLTIELI